MRSIKTGICAAILLAVITMAACKKSGVSPSNSSQVSFQMQADNSATTLAATPGASNGLVTNSVGASISGLTWTSGIANISKFKLEAKKKGTGIEIESKNLTSVDLFALSPLAANVTVDTGTYKEIEVRVELLQTTTGAIPLTLKGTFTNSGGATTPIEFDLNDDVTIKAEAQDVVINGTTDFAALVHMHLNKLVAGLTAADLDAAALTNNTIVISKTSNTAIYNKILANLTTCGDSEFKDEHHKG
jgi:hypothetical protein